MIKLFLLNNVYFKEVGQITLQELSSSKNIYDALIQKFQELGCVTKLRHGHIYIEQDKKLIHYDEKLMLSDDITIVYVDIIKLDNACEYDRENGIVYFFHTAEKGHSAYPHIHARYSGEEISIYLRNYRVIGTFKSRKKQNQAIEYIKSNRKDIGTQWNNIMNLQGGPKWEE